MDAQEIVAFVDRHTAQIASRQADLAFAPDEYANRLTRLRAAMEEAELDDADRQRARRACAGCTATRRAGTRATARRRGHRFTARRPMSTTIAAAPLRHGAPPIPDPPHLGATDLRLKLGGQHGRGVARFLPRRAPGRGMARRHGRDREVELGAQSRDERDDRGRARRAEAARSSTAASWHARCADG